MFGDAVLDWFVLEMEGIVVWLNEVTVRSVVVHTKALVYEDGLVYSGGCCHASISLAYSMLCYGTSGKQWVEWLSWATM